MRPGLSSLRVLSSASALSAIAASAAIALVVVSGLRADEPRGHVTRIHALPEAPFPQVPGAPQVIVQPSDVTGAVDVVLYLHGYDGCIEVLASEGPARCRAGLPLEAGWGLLEAHRESATESWLVMPQLAFRTRDGSPGGLARRGSARRLIDASLARAARARGVPPPSVRSVTLVAHSAGFEAAIAVIRRGELGDSLRHVVLFDAMYSGVPVFGGWAAGSAERSLIAFHTAGGTPARRADELRARYQRSLGARLLATDTASVEQITPGSVALIRARTSHREVPRRYLGATLARLLGRPLAPR